MSEAVYERLKKNLEILHMKNTSLILDNYLEKAIHDKKNIVEVLDYLLAEEAKTKKDRAVENQIKMSGFPYTCLLYTSRQRLMIIRCFPMANGKS